MPNKRIILMYISEISGHHSATIAIEKALRLLEPGVEIMNINAFNYTNPVSEKIVNRIYLSVIKRTPQIWEYLYDNPAVVKRITRLKTAVHKLNSPKFKNLFERFAPDVVACTQAFPCGMVADYKRIYGSAVPLVAVLTDFIPHAYWVYDTVDRYIVPAEEVGRELVSRGVPADIVEPLGIPFDHKFNEPVNPAGVVRALGLEPGLPTVLVMGGGQGLGPIKAIVESLEEARSDFQEIVVTGSNKRLYRTLKKRMKKFAKKIHLFGYVNNVHELMAVSSVVITKPGGITTAEAMSKKLPMIIIRPIPGQEASNTAFLTARGAALKIADAGQTHSAVDALFLHPDKLAAMREAAAGIGKPRASLEIARLMLALSKKKHD